MHVDPRVTLKHLTNALLNPDHSYQQMFDAAAQLYQFFTAAVSMQEEDPKNKRDLLLPLGKAIAPVSAGLCIRDFYRTRQLLRGISAGIRRAIELFPGAPVHVLYAGTGPFATLALPLTTLFSARDVQFTLLEINPESVQMLRKALRVCQAENHIREIAQCDATAYQATTPVHMIISETMQQALQEEPQVAITRNLAPQLVKGGILIPQKIAISAGLFHFKNSVKENTPENICRLLCPVFELSAHTPEINTDGFFPEVLVDLPQQLEPGFDQLCLFTEIQVFENIHLRMAESGLTQPKVLLQAQAGKTFDLRKVGLQYRLTHKPGFHLRFLS